nr:MAG TPA: hypothetical protein [Caudoviricetes sp.]
MKLGQEAYFSRELRRRVCDVIDENITIGKAVQWSTTDGMRAIKPFTTGTFAGVVIHTDDNKNGVIEYPTTASILQLGNICVKVEENVGKGDKAGVNNTGGFVKAASGTEIRGYYETAAKSGELAILVLEGIA